MTEHESAHVKALKAREPFQMALDITGCYGHTGDPLPKVVVRVNSKKADNEAIESAHVSVARRAKALHELTPEDRDRLVSDPDFLTDAKTIEALWRAIRDADDPTMHAFPSPEWMKENMDSDQLGALLNAYEHVRQRRGPKPWDISNDWIHLVRGAVVSSIDLPELPLAAWSREYLVEFLVETLRLWDRERTAFEQELKRPSGNQDQDQQQRQEEGGPGEPGTGTVAAENDPIGAPGG